MDGATVNILVSVALMMLGVSALLLLGSALPLMSQASQTLNAYRKLAETMEREVQPTLGEVRDVMHSVIQIRDGLNQIKAVTTQRVTDVSTKVDAVAGSFSNAAEEAKKQSSIWSTGLFAGVKAYLSGKDVPGEVKQISSDRGEKHVELNH